MKSCVIYTVLAVSLLAALASARPQSSLTSTTPEALAVTEATSTTTSTTTTIKPTKAPRLTLATLPSRPPATSPPPVWSSGGAVINKNGLRLSAGSSYAAGDISNNVYNAVGSGSIALHSSELDKPVKYQLGASGFTSPSQSNLDSSDYKFVYLKAPHEPGEKRNLVYVLVPHHVENEDLDRLNEVARSGVRDLRSSAKREVEKVEEEVTGILSYVPSSVRSAFRNFFGLKKTFNFFNIFVNSNLHTAK